jgi:hypothetical protein
VINPIGPQPLGSKYGVHGLGGDDVQDSQGLVSSKIRSFTNLYTNLTNQRPAESWTGGRHDIQLKAGYFQLPPKIDDPVDEGPYQPAKRETYD